MKTISYLFKVYRKTCLILLFSVVSTALFAQNIGINTTGATPSQNAILDLSTGNTHNMGLLIPRVVLGASLNTYSPPMAYASTGKDSGMMVYNWVATNQPIGYYWWSGTTWVSVSAAATPAWNLTGNAGTTPGTNYAGTSDANDFVIKTNATERMRILSTGNAGINTAPIATQMLTVAQTSSSNIAIMGENTAAAGTDNGIGVYGVSSQAYVAGPKNGYGVVALNNNANGTGLYAAGNNLGINAAIYTPGAGATFAGALGAMGYSPYNNGAGLWGENTGTSGWGVYGEATGTTSVGVVGVGDNATALLFPSGAGGSFSATAAGAFGTASNATGIGVVGLGNGLVGGTNPAVGSGGAFTGSSIGAYGFASTAGSGIGVEGMGNNLGGGTVLAVGSGGAFNGTSVGAFGYATTAASGTGIVGVGNNDGSIYTLATGSGGAFTGTNVGVYGTTTGASFGGANTGLMGTGTDGVMAYGSTYGVMAESPVGAIQCYNTSTGNYVYVDYYNGITNYKIAGTSPGTVSMSVQDTKGNYVVMHAPETPECYFEDYGEGQLTNGKAHIDLDPTVAKNICVNGKHPLRVFIQLEGNCKGVYVTNKSANGFDVVELDGGTSGTSFEYHIIANEADAIMPSGQTAKFADLRLEPAPKDMGNASQLILQPNSLKPTTSQNIPVSALPAEKSTILKGLVTKDEGAAK